MIPRPANPLVVALDVSDLDTAESLAGSLEGIVGMYKIGLELFTAHGPASVLRLRHYGPVFLDLKLHDIPTTVERAARNCARMGVASLPDGHVSRPRSRGPRGLRHPRRMASGRR